MKIGLIYTSTTPELISLVEEEVKKQIGEAELYSLQDPSILAETREAGYVTPGGGGKADSVQAAAAYIGVPIVRVDEEMCREAVRRGKRIGVMATLPTTLEPTRNTIRRMSRECGRAVELTDCLVEGAFGLNQEEFRQRMAKSAGTIADSVDVIVLAQGSMAYCERYISELYQKTVLSSLRFGAAELRKALRKKGVL